MRKNLFLIICFLVTFLSASAQNLSITFGKASVNVDQTAEIDVTASNFNELFGLQFTMTWDSTKFKYDGFSNKITTGTLPGEFEIGFPEPGSIIKQGKITVSWGNINTASLPNGTRLFTLKLKPVGQPCDSTAIVPADIPTKSEYYDKNFTPLKMTFINGSAKINGTGCSGGGGGSSTDILIKAATVNANPGSVACVPITADNIIKIASIQSVISWDPAVLKLKLPIAFDIFPGNQYNSSSVNAGKFNFLWLIPNNLGTSVTHPNGTKIMELCFDVLGAVGTSSPVTISNKSDETVFANEDGKEIKYQITNGRVNVTNQASLELNIGKVNVASGSEINVPITVNNFNAIQSGSFAITYDPTILEFVGRNSDADPAAGSSQLVSPGRFNYNYLTNKSGGNTLPNGTVLFNIRFKALPCSGANKVSEVTIKDQSNLAVEFVNSNAQKVPHTVSQGSATVSCSTSSNCTASVTNSTNVSCAGGNNGAINVSIMNTTGSCTAAWKKDGAAFGNSVAIANANISALSAGVYVLEVTCDGKLSCSATATITQPSAINVSETIKNIDCTNATGSIELAVTGGTVGSGYKFAWSNTATTKDISGLSAGNFTVTVTDANNCVTSKSFTLTNTTNTNPVAKATGTNVSCNGKGDGSITVTVEGGCAPYKYAWANSTITEPNRTALSPGTYTVTVSDASSPAKTSTAQVVITEPKAITIDGTTVASTGSNGSITVTATEGNGGYTYNWGNNITTKDRNGLAAGNYTITVTDSKGCTASKTFTVSASGGQLALGSVTVASGSKNSGFGVSCVNRCDAEITGNTSGGVAPFTVAISGTSTASTTLQQSGAFSFKELCAGNYTVRVTDGQGNSVTQAIIVTSPTAITLSESTKCATGAIPSGSIDLSVIGGAPTYKFAWSNNETTEDLKLLPVGTYTVVVSDANGCQSIAKTIRVEDCNGGNECFKDYTTIFTPNSDGFNDLFNISCATDHQNELFVYDRWGKPVYSVKNYGNSWDGKDTNGTDLPEGGYMWVMNVTYKDGSRQTFKGATTILRNN